MIVTIMPSQANGKTDAPPSKSMAHRLLICAGLAEGTSEIQNIDFSEDILATIDCLRALGAEISCGDRCVTVRNPLRTGNDLPETAQDGPFPVTVTAKDDTHITLDANHEMAGKELNFRIELLEVQE